MLIFSCLIIQILDVMEINMIDSSTPSEIEKSITSWTAVTLNSWDV